MKNVIPLIGLLTAVVSVSVNGQAVLTNGLVGYYPFSGNANDASGSGNNALSYGAQLATNRFGAAFDSYSFASGEYIKTTSAVGFPISTNDFTISLWVCPALDVSTSYQALFSNQSDAQFLFTICPLVTPPGNPPVGALKFLTGGPGHANDCQTGSLIWESNRWYNVQLVRSTNLLSIYRDNVRLAQQVTTYGNNATGANRLLSFSYSVYPLYGQLDDIRIYNRALSTNELTSLYQYEAFTPAVGEVSRALGLSLTNLATGFSYQIQTSSDMATWTNYGVPFVAPSSSCVQYVDVGWSNAFFRVQRQ